MERVVCLSPAATEIIFALGAGSKIIGRAQNCDYPEKTKNIQLINEKNNLFLEELKPDLVIADKTKNLMKKECEKRKITLKEMNPCSLQDIYDSVWDIARLVDKENRADNVVYDIEMKLQKLQRNPETRKKIYCEEWHSPPLLAAKWIPQLIECAGGISISSAGNESYEITPNEVQNFNPDIIVLHWRGFGNASKPDLLRKRKGWSAIKAVNESSIHCVDDVLLNRPGPRIWQGAEALQKLLKKT
jgi:iron complex transport system substrate-binding protein